MNFVEIAGIKWATCNVGAEKPTDAGLYFQWGDRKGYTVDEVGKVKMLDLRHYKHYNGKRFTKYNEFDNKHVLDLCDDPAFAYMGHGWRMPTDEEFRCLVENTTQRWTNNYNRSGVAGTVFTDRTDKSKKLFFPAVGLCYQGSVLDVGSYGYYWSSSPIYSITCGKCLYFYSSDIDWSRYSSRYYGFPVRGILKLKERIVIQ